MSEEIEKIRQEGLVEANLEIDRLKDENQELRKLCEAMADNVCDSFALYFKWKNK